MKRILFVSKGQYSPSTRYRALQFFPYLQQRGYRPEHVTVSGGLLPLLKTLRLASRADVVVVLRKTFPIMVSRLLRLVSKRLIFDLDDAVFCSSKGAPSRTRMQRFAMMAKLSDHIFAGNQFLAQKSAEFNHNVTIIPTCLEVEKYAVEKAKVDNYIDLVWIGSESTSKYLFNILPILEKIAQKQPALRLKIIADFDLPEAKLPVLTVAWDQKTEALDLASAHIGIAPMIGNDWTRGKCALKVLQYMAAKLPVISSNVGVNAEAVISGETGWLVNSDEQWIQAIDKLISHKELRIKMGLAGYNRVREYYDIDIVFPKMYTVLDEMTS